MSNNVTKWVGCPRCDGGKRWARLVKEPHPFKRNGSGGGACFLYNDHGSIPIDLHAAFLLVFEKWAHNPDRISPEKIANFKAEFYANE